MVGNSGSGHNARHVMDILQADVACIVASDFYSDDVISNILYIMRNKTSKSKSKKIIWRKSNSRLRRN